MKPCAEMFIEFLKAKNMNFQSGTDSDGDTVVEFPYDGKVTKLFFCGEQGEYLSMYLVYEHVPDDKLADVIFACNELNNNFKWVTYYVDRDNDVICHDDAILTVENAADEAFELLVRLLQITDKAKPTIMKAIYA